MICSGLPSKLENGIRTLYNSTQRVSSKDSLGLSRLYLGGSLNLNSSRENLAYSYGDGRVVLVAREAACAEKKAK